MASVLPWWLLIVSGFLTRLFTLRAIAGEFYVMFCHNIAGMVFYRGMKVFKQWQGNIIYTATAKAADVVVGPCCAVKPFLSSADFNFLRIPMIHKPFKVSIHSGNADTGEVLFNHNIEFISGWVTSDGLQPLENDFPLMSYPVC